MNLFDQDLIEYVIKQCQSAFSVKEIKENEKAEIRLFIKSMPPVHVLHLFQAINDYSIETSHNLERHFKVATGLWEYWQEQGVEQGVLNQLDKSGWVDHEDRFTYYRNMSCPDDRGGLMVVLVGLDHATDQGGLADFHVVTDDTLWDLVLNNSYSSWVSKILEGMDSNEQSNKLLLDLFVALNRQRHRDLLHLSDYIETKLLVEEISSSQDLIDLLFETLPAWGIPPLLQVPSNPKQAINLFNQASGFINHQYMDTPIKRKKVLNAFDKAIDEELLDKPETVGVAIPYKELGEYINTVKSFIHNNDLISRDRLLETDITQLLTLILRRERKKGKAKVKLTKLRGPSLQVFYEAIWLTLVDFKKGCGAMWAPELLVENEGIIITITAFKHDLSEEEKGEGQAQGEAAKSFLKSCLGGLEKFLKDRPFSLHSSRDNIDSSKDMHLYPELKWGSSESDIAYKVVHTIPTVEFEVYIPSSFESYEVRNRFAWVIDGNVGERVRVLTARTVLKSIQSRLSLPAFNIPRVMTELFFAADEEEANRLLKEGLTDLKVVDVLDGLDSRNVDDRLWNLGKNLQEYYRVFLRQYLDEGYYVAQDQSLHNLINAYEKIANALLENDLLGRNQYLNRFYKAFLAIPISATFEDSYLQQAITFGITPAVAELAQARDAFLGEGFAEVVFLLLEGELPRAKASFDRLIGLVELRRPLICLIKNQDHSLTTRIRSFDLIHCIGDAPTNELSLASQGIMREELLDGTDSISNLIKVNEESRIVYRLIDDYCKLHPYAHDQLNILVVNVADIHVTLAGVHQFLEAFLVNEAFLGTAPYQLNLKVITTSSSPTVSANQLISWRDYWLEQEPKNLTRKLRLSIGHSYAKEPTSIETLLNDEKDKYDIAILMHFLDSREGGDEVEPTDQFIYNLSSPNIRKFPISEYPQPVRAEDKLNRRSLLSNRRLRIPTLHAELSAHLKHPNDQHTDHIVLGLVDYSPWQRVVSRLHGVAQWVACLDPYVDKSLLETGLNLAQKDLKIIGFSSGLGLYGELNLTVSTQADTIASLTELIANKLSNLYPDWEGSTSEQAAKTVVRQAQEITGLSLVKATGGSQYIRDVVAYSATRKLLGAAKEGHITELIPFDSFRHWFNDSKSPLVPDLLYLDAFQDGKQLRIKATIIECKLAACNERHIKKAVQQIDGGLSQLCRVFMPNKESSREQLSFDRRYWWAQLQRTLASRAMVNLNDQRFRDLSAALEMLSEGYFQIDWKALIITFWNDTNDVSNSIENLGTPSIFDIEGDAKSSNLCIYHQAYGIDELANILTKDGIENLVVPGKPQSYYADSVEQLLEHIQVEKPTQKIEEDYKGVPDKAVEPFPNIKKIKEEEFIQEIELSPKIEKDNKGVPAQVVEPTKNNQEVELIQEIEPLQKIESAKEIGHIQEVKSYPPVPLRVLLGTGRNDKEYFWEFGHSELNNRHLLIFGTSGSGKTYAIQTLLSEFAKQGQNSLVVDYTDGFLPDHLEAELTKRTKIKNHFVITEPLPINPFQPQQRKIIKGIPAIKESYFNVASRIATIFNAVYSTIGEQQNPLLIKVIEEGLNNDPSYTFNSLIQDLEAEGDRGEALAAKLMPFIRTNPFVGDNPESWGDMLNNLEERVQILQLTAISRDIQRLITEFVLWDIYNYAQTHGSKDNPIPIVLDEIQNLDHRADSPLDKLIREGRKFGISLILATQTLSMFDKEQQSRLFLAGHKLFFAPAGKEVREIAGLLRDSVPGSNLDEWIEKLNGLGKGECLSLGPVKQEGSNLKNRVVKLKITPLEDRE